MNNETTDFARWVRAPRQSVDRSSYSGIEHCEPEPHEWRGWAILRAAVALLATIITNTPGTVSCVVDEKGHCILVHALDGSAGADTIAADIKARYEAPLKEMFE